MAESDANRHKRVALAGVAICVRELLEFSSSSSSEEELNVLEGVLPQQECRKRRHRTIPRIENYVEEVMLRWLDTDFKSHFRMRRETFEYVLSIIGMTLTRKYPGLGMISPEKQLLLTIWRMATPDEYRSICEKFNVSRATALATVRRVTDALVNLAPSVIRWPTRALAEASWRGFEGISAFPKVLGAVDGTHIHIPAPRVNPESYINRKGFHSIQLQAVCDHKARFFHCLVGHVGSVHDQRVFRLSEIQDFLGKEEKFPDDCHLVGDPAYKLYQNLLVPYRDNGHLSERQKNYNFCLSSARIAIERAFGLLKTRFRSLLHCLAMTKTKDVANFVLTCCVLHNICVMQGDELNINLAQQEEEGPIAHVGGQACAGAAFAKRDLICERLIMRNV